MNVEAVAWIAERRSMLSMVFFLLTLAAYQWYARRSERQALYAGGHTVPRWALLAKPQVITLPFVLLLSDLLAAPAHVA